MKSNVSNAYLEAIRKDIGSQIVEYRSKKGLSQRGLAELAGTSQRAVGKIERGEWSAGLDSLLILAYYLDYTVVLAPRNPEEDLRKSVKKSKKEVTLTM